MKTHPLCLPSPLFSMLPFWQRCRSVLRHFATASALALLPLAAFAVCLDNDPDVGWDYEGSLADKYRIRMTLVFEGSSVTGSYFYASQLKDIKLRGSITDGRAIVLEELDAAGKVSARFTGNFVDVDPKGKFPGGKLACESIVGSWQKVGAKESLALYASMEGSTSGDQNHRYAVAGADDDKLVERNAQRFWQAVKQGDQKTVAALVVYPVKVSINGKNKRIRNAQELMQNYEQIFTQSYRDAILAALPHNMFARDKGIMLGRGVVWFGADGKAFALNN